VTETNVKLCVTLCLCSLYVKPLQTVASYVMVCVDICSFLLFVLWCFDFLMFECFL